MSLPKLKPEEEGRTNHTFDYTNCWQDGTLRRSSHRRVRAATSVPDLAGPVYAHARSLRAGRLFVEERITTGVRAHRFPCHRTGHCRRHLRHGVLRLPGQERPLPGVPVPQYISPGADGLGEERENFEGGRCEPCADGHGALGDLAGFKHPAGNVNARRPGRPAASGDVARAQ